MTDFAFFMFFSTLEGISLYTLALYCFRVNFERYFWHSILIIELINYQNYLTRHFNVEDAFAVAPIVNLVITMLFFKTIVRVPLIWSIFMTLTGFAFFMAIQTIIVYSVFGGVSHMQDKEIYGYFVQLLTGAICYGGSRFLYLKGYGFTFDLEKLRLWGEGMIVTLLIVILIVGFIYLIFQQNLFWNLVGSLAGLFIFLYYSVRREKTHGL
ncbi:hypothetical protein [Paenibacillus sacheonensis]|uniref:Uncharacterized protein n=1 Tax=Paenibacillus sacheonensis TaxID=742054 RepID=A0A7X4YLV6_9BACL|nr:hypothetical protein [Paenibacillus sacheonensis]MBM7563811.1 hypothetical protein [Paenibacillus sacheonensis]NBC67839.1 hypothetical protein [Paenibacillus sacheonensis]